MEENEDEFISALRQQLAEHAARPKPTPVYCPQCESVLTVEDAYFQLREVCIHADGSSQMGDVIQDYTRVSDAVRCQCDGRLWTFDQLAGSLAFGTLTTRSPEDDEPEDDDDEEEGDDAAAAKGGD
jgi:nitrite reductase/ring-hydroxylating ferredoxin subunit